MTTAKEETLRCEVGVFLILDLEHLGLSFLYYEDAVAALHAHYKVDLQYGQGHVCSHYAANGVTCLADHPPVWLE